MLHLLRAIYESIADRAAMHVGPLVGAAAALVTDFFFSANSQIQIAIMLGVAIVAREGQEASRYGSIRDCKQAIASYVRSVLDTPLDITRFDRVHLGDYLTLRRIGNRARSGGIASVAASSGPSDTLAEAVGALSLSLEAEIGRCYGKLRGRDQGRIDAFATALKRAGATARTSISPPFDETYEARAKKLTDSLAAAFVAAVEAGDALDEAFDSKAHRESGAEHAASDAAKRAEEWDAGEVLLVNARAVEQMLYVDGVGPDAIADLEELAKRIRAARDVGLHVDAAEYERATDEVRAAHHRIVYDDLFAALELVETARRTKGQDGSIGTARELVARVSPDIEDLQARCAALPGARPL